VPYRTLARFAAAECGFSSAKSRVTVQEVPENFSLCRVHA
jgi:hypothetical protein